MRSKNGFSLVELLTVIGIIGLLVSILIPALNAARIAAWTAMCRANLHNIGVGFTQYGNNNRNVLPPQAFWNTSAAWNNYTPLPTTLSYYTGYLKREASTAQGPVTLMKPFGIGALYDSGLNKDLETFYCPGFRPKNHLSDYDIYKADTYIHPTTGAYYIPSSTKYPQYLLNGYHFFKNNIALVDEMGSRSYVYDLIYDWTATPHASSNGKPKGLNVLYGDGHAEFNPDCMNDTLWGDLTGTNPAQTPNGNLDLWFPILEKLGNNTPDLKEIGTWSNYRCLGDERDSSRGAQLGTWTYGY